MQTRLLEATIESIGEKTSIENFYPLTTKFDRSERVFSINEIIGLFVSGVSQKIMKDFDKETFKERCLKSFESNVDDPSFLGLIEELYFSSDTLELDSLLVYQTFLASNNSKNVYKVFEQLIDFDNLDIDFKSDISFMDKIIIDELQNNFKDLKIQNKTNSYLPFLDKVFNKDLKSLSLNKHYFKQNIEKFFDLYLFLYSSQLALNLIPNRNALTKPEAKELYFILTHEKASTERTKIVEQGYTHLFNSVKYIFPYMSLLTSISNSTGLNDLRLYELIGLIGTDDRAVKAVDAFSMKFREAKKLNAEEHIVSENIEESLDTLLNLAFDQFKENCIVDRKRAFTQYESAFKRQISKEFTINRRRAGNVLVLDQDMVLFLTNVIIGKNGKIRFQRLLEEFKNRGICFDIRSQNELIILFERVGNIERKSDSGDAVYVKATI